MRDLDIRKALRSRLAILHQNDADTLIIEELGLEQGTSKIDMAVINGALNGFEIKSDRDTLDRLPLQQSVYSRVLDTVTIVAGFRHLDRIQASVPKWWGIAMAAAPEGVVTLEFMRHPRSNPAVDPLALAKLLWRQEALEVLKELGLARGMSGKNCRDLWVKLAECSDACELGHHVRRIIKRRGDWRAAQRQARGNDWSPTSASPQDLQANLSWLLDAESVDRPC